MLAEAAHLLRVFDAAGIAPDAGFSRMHCCFAVGADLYGGIAKTRAAAQVFARLAEACGVASGPVLNDLHGVTSARQMTRLDADTNMLRGGTALLGMVLGGVGVATSLPHDWLTGSRMESRRLARNSHHIMAAEARLDQVIDPAAGSFYIDQLTHALASKHGRCFPRSKAKAGLPPQQHLCQHGPMPLSLRGNRGLIMVMRCCSASPATPGEMRSSRL